MISRNAVVDELVDLAVAGLVAMFCPESQMFCHRRRLSGGQLANEGLSPRYTVMSLLGLARYQMTGRPLSTDIRAAICGLLQAVGRVPDLGDSGLLLWLCSLAAPDLLAEASDRGGLNHIAKSSRLASRVGTMELAWLLSGFAHAKLTPSAVVGFDLAEAASECFRLLRANQGPKGLFGHSAPGSSVGGMLRGRIGSFADQVYPIYALSRFGQAFGRTEAIEMARRCADAICRLQGPLGQWWWHYDSRAEKVVERYPVYSVHQHGMAPMALFAVMEAAGVDFCEAIYRGLEWVTGANELRTNMCDGDRNIVWRSFYRRASWRIPVGKALCILGREDRSGKENLEVLFECRPYELGWLLYAFAGRETEHRGVPTATALCEKVVEQ